MTSRRTFLKTLAATGVAPSLTWADARAPSFLSAAMMPDGSFGLIGLDGLAAPLFTIPLPTRGHAACVHPVRPEAIAFARRPGTFAVVIDCARGETIATLESPPERHFYGHGAFSRSGDLLFTTENAYEIGEGRIGIWYASAGYRRVGEIRSGGIGPHEVRRLPGSDILLVANGGIDTHPETGREKLNLPTMRSNLSYVTQDGNVLDQVELPTEQRLNSIRHIDAGPDGIVAFACQWQGALSETPPLQGVHRMGEPITLLPVPGDLGPLAGYAGSVAVTRTGAGIGVTYPRANTYIIWPDGAGSEGTAHRLTDACGISASKHGFVVTSGEGRVIEQTGASTNELRQMPCSWDNHLIPVA
ncbi:MAG: DUF1513 domain-containing protein [Pseudomonadota bacterium]